MRKRKRERTMAAKRRKTERSRIAREAKRRVMAEVVGGGGRRKWNSLSERVTLAGKSKDENNRAIKKTR